MITCEVKLNAKPTRKDEAIGAGGVGGAGRILTTRRIKRLYALQAVGYISGRRKSEVSSPKYKRVGLKHELPS